MNATLFNSLLLAAQKPSAKAVATAGTSWWISGLLIGGALVFVAGAVIGWRWYRGRRLAATPAGIWRDLCNAHRLDKLEINALQQLAALRQLDPPALLFVQPQVWQLANAKNRLGGQVAILQRVEKQLFS